VNSTDDANRFHRNDPASPRFRTPPPLNLLPRHPLRAALGQVLTLRNQTLMNRTGQQGDAVPADLVAEVLAGDADGTGAGRFEDIPLQVIPLFWVGQDTGSGHRRSAGTPVLLLNGGGVKESPEMPANPDRAYPSNTGTRTPMNRLLLLGLLTVLPSAAAAQRPPIQCPGANTVEMRYCAEKSWEQSDAQLRQKVSKQLMEQWHEATKALCAAAYAPYKDGTIYPQLVVGCDDHLNRALLKEFAPLNNQGDLERTP
jgi:hypothetical protein